MCGDKKKAALAGERQKPLLWRITFLNLSLKRLPLKKSVVLFCCFTTVQHFAFIFLPLTMFTVIETYNKHTFLLCSRLRQHIVNISQLLHFLLAPKWRLQVASLHLCKRVCVYALKSFVTLQLHKFRFFATKQQFYVSIFLDATKKLGSYKLCRNVCMGS